MLAATGEEERTLHGQEWEPSEKRESGSQRRGSSHQAALCAQPRGAFPAP